MKNFSSLVAATALLTAVLALCQGASDVCLQPFSSLLGCVVGDLENRFSDILTETSGTASSRIQQCFTKNGCAAPNFDQQQAINVFLNPEWAARLDLFFDLVSQTPEAVQHCMTDYFKELARKKSEDCIREFGGETLSTFSMPPIPGLYSFKLQQIKETFFHQMLTRHSVIKCAACKNDFALTKRIIHCVKGVEAENIDGACNVRDQCAKNHLPTPTCQSRFTSVKEAACKCSATKLRVNGLKDLLNNFEEVKTGLLSGGFAEQYKQCFAVSNAPFPQAAFDKANTAVQQSLVDIAFSKNGLDLSLKYALSLAISLLKDTADQWKDLYCTSCSTPVKNGSNRIAAVFHKIAATGVVKCDSQ
uniref:Uncharacterized protein n=1 Tax=Plectus sambesii TaxID=2011161 RepID=A0A914W3N2_9BILA